MSRGSHTTNPALLFAKAAHLILTLDQDWCSHVTRQITTPSHVIVESPPRVLVSMVWDLAWPEFFLSLIYVLPYVLVKSKLVFCGENIAYSAVFPYTIFVRSFILNNLQNMIMKMRVFWFVVQVAGAIAQW